MAGKISLGTGCGVVIWENQNDWVHYERPDHHTFSLYLKDGTGTRRLDAGGIAGWPGAVCILPAGHRSDWEITSASQFVHLYLSDEALRSAFSRIHACDARRLDLAEENFVDKPEVSVPLAELARAAVSNDPLRADTALAEFVARLPGRTARVSGGLPPYVIRRVEEYVVANLSGTIRLDDLAELAGMSGFHFHRMFRLARGCPPHVWITQHRVHRAKVLLRTPVSIAEVAVACGFSSQSHLTRVFREQTGRTPGQFRRAWQAR
ncbi:helix-turn-helix transcriptional regulator [Rhodovibrio salinarum]|nr:AraC family transcriptional regulator [Rhodovibrio salinarum]